jgi:hypothetical protein
MGYTYSYKAEDETKWRNLVNRYWTFRLNKLQSESSLVEQLWIVKDYSAQRIYIIPLNGVY